MFNLNKKRVFFTISGILPFSECRQFQGRQCLLNKTSSKKNILFLLLFACKSFFQCYRTMFYIHHRFLLKGEKCFHLLLHHLFTCLKYFYMNMDTWLKGLTLVFIMLLLVLVEYDVIRLFYMCSLFLCSTCSKWDTI